jgi:hypothetical protein
MKWDKLIIGILLIILIFTSGCSHKINFTVDDLIKESELIILKYANAKVVNVISIKETFIKIPSYVIVTGSPNYYEDKLEPMIEIIIKADNSKIYRLLFDSDGKCREFGEQK